jgi:hypothetical protein
VRTDFFSRPPCVSATELAELWREQEGRDPAFTGPLVLLRIKQTAREQNWPFVGELARLLMDPRETFLHARSAGDLIALASAEPGLAREMTPRRPALATLSEGLDGLRMALERERPPTASARPGVSGESRPRDQFLSEEDLDLANLPSEEVALWWGYFLRQAQASNDLDVDEYSYGIFMLPRSEWPPEFRDMGRRERS